MKKGHMVFTLLFFFTSYLVYAREVPFTDEDRQRLVRLESTVQRLESRVQKLENRVQRLEDTVQRLESTVQRLEAAVHELKKNLQEDRERLIRLEATMKEFKDSVDKRFEQIDKRFEQIDKRFEQMMAFLGIITGLFVAITLFTIGFALWDRRTMIKRAREEAVEEVEKRGVVKNIIYALREFAKENPRLSAILEKFHLL